MLVDSEVIKNMYAKRVWAYVCEDNKSWKIGISLVSGLAKVISECNKPVKKPRAASPQALSVSNILQSQLPKYDSIYLDFFEAICALRQIWRLNLNDKFYLKWHAVHMLSVSCWIAREASKIITIPFPRYFELHFNFSKLFERKSFLGTLRNGKLIYSRKFWNPN